MKKVIIIFVFLIGIFLISFGCYYNYQLSPIDKNSNSEIEFIIKSGTSTKMIAKMLEEKGLIRSDTFLTIYLKINKINNIKASTYILKKNMGLKEIINIISNGNGYNPNEVSITFKEGNNIRSFATTISNKTNNKYNDVIKKFEDKDYINELIKKYWFLTDEIKNEEIFYPLEGYLFPNTYRFKDKNASIEDIFLKLLDETDKILSKYKDKIEKQDLTVHEILTFASIIELEGLKSVDKPKIASVFYNRLKKGMSLGSDVTACYAQKIDDTALCHNTANFNYNSPYNTRLITNLGLPIGPIANPGEDSIEAVLNPATTDYIYFVADKYTNVYFFKTYTEFETKIKELKKNGDWL